MAVKHKTIQTIEHIKKVTSQGTGGRSRGVKISKVDGANVTLVGHGNTAFAGLSPSSQMLICIDEQHGAGGMDATGLVIAGGTTIYGRWSSFATTDGDPAICYFGV